MITQEKQVITNEGLVQQFAEYLERQGKAKHTARAYVADVRKLTEFVQRSNAAINLCGIQCDIIEAFVQQSNGSPSSDSTIKRQIMGLRKFFSFLMDCKLIQANPMSSVSVSNVPTQAIPVDKLERAFRYVGQQMSEDPSESIRYCRDELILMFMLFLGFRQYEIPSLRISGLKKENGTYFITIGQGNKQKLDATTLQLLHAYLKGRQSNGDIIFVNPTGKRPVTMDSLRSLMTELSYAAGCPVNPKTIRHTHEQFLANPSDADAMLKVIADIHVRRELQ